MYLRSGIGLTPAVCQMKNGSFCRPKQSAANSVADQVDVGEGGADEGAGQGVVLQTKKGHHIEILGGFHRCGENHDIDRQESDALGEEDPAEAADQRRYKYVADVGPNEIKFYRLSVRIAGLLAVVMYKMIIFTFFSETPNRRIR